MAMTLAVCKVICTEPACIAVWVELWVILSCLCGQRCVTDSLQALCQHIFS
jgi:hypothetical protein